MTSTEHQPVDGPSADEPVAKKAAKRRLWPWIVGVLAVVVFIALALPVFSTLQPAYYERYPQLKGRMANWRNSTHARVDCAGCHMDPGPIGFLTFAAKSIPDFYSQLVYGPSATNLLSVPDRDACQKCHTNYRQVSPGGDLLIPHRAHVEVLKMNCADCHKNLVHSVNRQGFNRPEMETCLRCHNGVKASAKCASCHTKKQVPPSHKQADWLAVHSTETKTGECGRCHGWSPDYCAECHAKRPPSHAGNWKLKHAGPAKANPKRCMVCHKEQFCKKCHP